MIKRTYQPSIITMKRKHGFRARMINGSSPIMNNRRRKGRKELCA